MKKNLISKFKITAFVALWVVALWGCSSSEPEPGPRSEPVSNSIIVAITGQAGPVDGTNQNSDEFIWNLFTQFTAPVEGYPAQVVFETWASDADTFSKTPQWPELGEPKKLQQSVLSKTISPQLATIGVPCVTPGNAKVGGFPTHGGPKPCIAEETKRNRSQFNYIIGNNLNTQEGLKSAFANSREVVMPNDAVSVKGDWIPVQTLLQWIPELGSIENIRSLYYTTISEHVEYAVVSLHVSSRQNPNWVWGTFEHKNNPGRCDYLGCLDSFGAVIPVVKPNRAEYNTQYGACEKTEALKTIMAEANLSPVWENYCMKSTMVDFAAPDGTPYALGNSVIEAITGNGTVVASSCITCHYYASFGVEGKTLKNVSAILPFNPTGKPIPGILDESIQFDFMWGVLLAP